MSKEVKSCKQCGNIIRSDGLTPYCSSECKKQYQQQRIRSAMNVTITNQDWPYGVSFSSMLMSEEYRLKVALDNSTTNSQAASLLGISVRTLYRWFEKYNVKGHEKI